MTILQAAPSAQALRVAKRRNLVVKLPQLLLPFSNGRCVLLVLVSYDALMFSSTDRLNVETGRRRCSLHHCTRRLPCSHCYAPGRHLCSLHRYANQVLCSYRYAPSCESESSDRLCSPLPPQALDPARVPGISGLLLFCCFELRQFSIGGECGVSGCGGREPCLVRGP